MDILEPVSRSPNLINAKECFILIIDVQRPFMEGLSEIEQKIFINKYCHLLRLCKALHLPFIITAEDIQKNGSIPAEILEILVDDDKIFDKFIYSCWGQKNIQKAIVNTQKKVSIICGFETDVCIMQTATDLIDNGYKVFILADITFSRNIFEHEIGLKRIEHQGAVLSGLKTWQEEITGGLRTNISRIIKTHRLEEI